MGHDRADHLVTFIQVAARLQPLHQLVEHGAVVGMPLDHLERFGGAVVRRL